MIENSDNDAASDLYDDDGEATGIDAVNKAFGLTDTAVGTDGYWGLTTTTVTDQLKVLRQVFTSDSLLTSSSRDYIQNLMSQVEADQRWGVSAAASQRQLPGEERVAAQPGPVGDQQHRRGNPRWPEATDRCPLRGRPD